MSDPKRTGKAQSKLSHGHHHSSPIQSLATVFAAEFHGVSDHLLTTPQRVALLALVGLPFVLAPGWERVRLSAACSQGRICCANSRRRAVASRDDRGCVLGIPYLVRYEFGSRSWTRRWRSESCRKVLPHSRQVTACLVILRFQSTWAASLPVSGLVMAIPGASRWCKLSNMECVLRSKDLASSGDR